MSDFLHLVPPTDEPKGGQTDPAEFGQAVIAQFRAGQAAQARVVILEALLTEHGIPIPPA